MVTSVEFDDQAFRRAVNHLGSRGARSALAIALTRTARLTARVLGRGP